MSNVKRADNFLKYLQKEIEKNKSIIESEDFYPFIYNSLIRFDIEEEDLSYDTSKDSLFGKWYMEFNNIPNINAFVSPTWTYFFQFTNKEEDVKDSSSQIKMYIPLDSKHLDEGVSKIFSFLAHNNIAHISKVSKKIRFDDIVIRVGNSEDAEVINKFVNSDKFIKKGLIKANPFAFTHNDIAYAIDKEMSFNELVSKYIELYIKDIDNNNKLDSINISDFYVFVGNYYNNNFLKEENRQKVIDDFKIKDSDEEAINSYKKMSNLMINAVSSSFNYSNYLKLSQSNSENIDKYTTKEELDSFLDKSMKIISKKYNDGAEAIMKMFLRSGDPLLLTRESNIRSDAIKYNIKEKIDKMLEKENMTFDEYFDKRYKEKESKQL